MITTEIIKNLNPCKNRLENYLNHYRDVTFTYGEFISLNKISFEDKIWVLSKLMSLENLVLFSQNAIQYSTRYADQYTAKSAAQEAAQNAARYASQVESRYFILNLTLNYL